MLEMTHREMFRGDDLVFALQVVAPPVLIPGQEVDAVPANITGWKFYFTVKLYLSDPDSAALYQTTNLFGGTIVVTNAAAGDILVTMPPSVTQSFPDGPVALVYSVRAIDTLGRAFTVDAGDITVQPAATNAIA